MTINMDHTMNCDTMILRTYSLGRVIEYKNQAYRQTLYLSDTQNIRNFWLSFQTVIGRFFIMIKNNADSKNKKIS